MCSIMDIMHYCDFIPFKWPRKEKERKTQAKTCCMQKP
jgi:hypothetical protein